MPYVRFDSQIGYGEIRRHAYDDQVAAAIAASNIAGTTFVMNGFKDLKVESKSYGKI